MNCIKFQKREISYRMSLSSEKKRSFIMETSLWTDMIHEMSHMLLLFQRKFDGCNLNFNVDTTI